MDEITVYVRIIIAVLGIAYPIILQAISQLDTKYNSLVIVELFDGEFRKSWFEFQLVTCICLLFIWSFKLPLIKQLQNKSELLDNSAAILLVISTILLVISFILLTNRIYTYLVPTKLVRYLIQRHEAEDQI
jgi:hypothetical protein